MIFVEGETARLLVDLLILFGALAALVHAVSRRKVVRPLYPLSGIVFLVIGTAIFVGVYLLKVAELYDVAAIFGVQPDGLLRQSGCGPSRASRGPGGCTLAR